jgi:hypothetical protein
MQRIEINPITEATLAACKEIQNSINEIASKLNSGALPHPFKSYRDFINKKIYQKLELLEYKEFIDSPENYINNVTNLLKKHFDEATAKDISLLIVFSHLAYFQKMNHPMTHEEMVDKLKNAGYSAVPEQKVDPVKDFYTYILRMITKTLSIEFPKNMKTDLILTYQKTRKGSVDKCHKIQNSLVEMLNARLTPDVLNRLNITMQLREHIETGIANLTLEKLPQKTYFEQMLQARITKQNSPEELLKEAVIQAKKECIDACLSVRLEQISKQYLEETAARYFNKAKLSTQNSSVMFQPKREINNMESPFLKLTM